MDGRDETQKCGVTSKDNMMVSSAKTRVVGREEEDT